ncbi:MAG: FkbM family methyltransferase [Bdellovibrionales bacterium]|nr:FkbM family methyltransferase [Bdellovibrionales bacterium]
MRTAHKIRLARTAYRVVHAFRGIFGGNDAVSLERRGIRWELDLREGIDFAIYLFGAFELSLVRFYSARIRPGDVVLDIGANVGAHTVPIARLVGSSGKVFAFEPTDYAVSKLRKNLLANSQASRVVTIEQAFLVANEDAGVAKEIYSSWPLTAEPGSHALHLGTAKSTSGARAETLDHYLAKRGVERVDWIKLDVDGYEHAVLAGGRKTLSRFKPKILMEFAPYLAEEAGYSFGEILGWLREEGYRGIEVENRVPVPLEADALRKRIPAGSSINVYLEARPA